MWMWSRLVGQSASGGCRLGLRRMPTLLETADTTEIEDEVTDEVIGVWVERGNVVAL